VQGLTITAEAGTPIAGPAPPPLFPRNASSIFEAILPGQRSCLDNGFPASIYPIWQWSNPRSDGTLEVAFLICTGAFGVSDGFDPQLIELLYQSVTDPNLWQVALEKIVAAFESDHATLFTNKHSALTMPFYAAAGLREDDQARYATPEANRIWAPLQMSLPAGTAISQQTILRDDDFERTEGYQELVKPTRCYYAGFIQQDVPDLFLSPCRMSSAQSRTLRK
jgi:hypothetical protein